MPTQAERSATSRRRLLEAAVALLAEKGVQATSVAEIGARAGMSRAAVNFHFGSKDALLAAIVTRVVEEWEESVLRPALARVTDFADALEATLHAHRRMVRDNEAAYRVYYVLQLESLGPAPQLRTEFVQLRRRFIAQIIAGMHRAGVDSGSGIDLEALATWFLGAMRGIGQQYLLEPEAVDLDAAHFEVAEAVRARVRAALSARQRAGGDPVSR